MAQNFDLLGDPIPEGFGRRGRPEHIPTGENRNRVMLLLALSWSDGQIAASLGITAPTLKKHYFRELRVRAEARHRVKARLAEATFAAALDGKPAAIRLAERMLNETVLQAQVIDGRAREVKPAKVGKKEERQLAAERVGGVYAVPPAPRLVVDNPA